MAIENENQAVPEVPKNQANQEIQEDFKKKYEEICRKFENFKAEQAAKEIRISKEKVLRNMLTEIGVSGKHIDKILKISDVDGVELDEKGRAKNAEKLRADMMREWADFVVKTGQKGADTAFAPVGGQESAKKSKEEILQIKDTAERQRAIAENLEFFN